MGEEVPTPTYPCEATKKKGVDDPVSPMTNAGLDELISIASSAPPHGLVVPIPTVSVLVVRRTTDPSSVQPESAAVGHASFAVVQTALPL